ncbi:uncharacterized protein LOC116604074 isoform X2 [Nematostella vectensis]|nr:uncharacterized protein LOC116604074 isoform X2 [Nematostella vectensis]
MLREEQNREHVSDSTCGGLWWLTRWKLHLVVLFVLLVIAAYIFHPHLFDYYFDVSTDHTNGALPPDTNTSTNTQSHLTFSISQIQDKDSLFITQNGFDCGKNWTREYQLLHAESLTSTSKDRKFLVYNCLGHGGGCGGYGNRMSALVSTFFLAVLLNRTFLIHWGGPEELEKLLEPHMIDWRYDERIVKSLYGRKTYWGLERIGGYGRRKIFRWQESQFQSWIKHVNFTEYFDRPVEQVETIWYFANQLWSNPILKKYAMSLGVGIWRHDYPYALTGCAFSFLFKKSKSLRDDFKKAKREIRLHRPIIGIHIITSDHHFGSRNPYSVRTRDPLKVFDCAQRVEDALKKKYSELKVANFTWFLAADNKKVKDQAVDIYPRKVSTLQLTPRHLDLSQSDHQQVLRDLLLDQLMLLECDFLIGTEGSTFTSVAQGTRLFPKRSFVYGEKCKLDAENVAIATPWVL